MRLAPPLLASALLIACEPAPAPLQIRAVTFNSGTSEGMPHDDPPEDGYTPDHALSSDQYYGDGLAWSPAVEATRRFFAGLDADVIGFQEIFHAADCASIPTAAQLDFYCQGWSEGDPTVAQAVLGRGWQVACHPGHPDKCAAVNRRFGRFRGCEADYCQEGLEGYRVDTCGRGARIGRGVIELVEGGELTLVNVHSSSGLTEEDQQCRVWQVEQVFVDLGDGAPGASGDRNVVLGDFNTDPGRFTGWDPSADRWADFVGMDKPFRFVTDVGPDAEPSYGGLVNIDHVVSDAFEGSCWVAGLSQGHPAVIDAIYFDHKPVVCDLAAVEP